MDTPKWQVQKGTEPPGGAHFETDPHTDKEREIYIYTTLSTKKPKKHYSQANKQEIHDNTSAKQEANSI